ncbi:MAG TPA: hypothetical protein VGJ25_09095 [Gaiellaceae bacterium]
MRRPETRTAGRPERLQRPQTRAVPIYAHAVDRANQPSAAGSDPGKLGLLLTLERSAGRRGRR